MEDMDTLRRDVDAIMRYLTKIDPLWNSKGAGGVIPPLSPDDNTPVAKKPYATPVSTDGARVRRTPTTVPKDNVMYVLPYGGYRNVTGSIEDESNPSYRWYILEDDGYARMDVMRLEWLENPPQPKPIEPVVPVYTGAAWEAPVTPYRVTNTHHNERNHEGIDLSAAIGTPVLCGTGGGFVTKTFTCVPCGLIAEQQARMGTTDPNTGYGLGNYVIVRYHATQTPAAVQALMGQKVYLYILYAHLSHIDVQPQQSIIRYGRIGKVGTSGNSTGPHLHIQARISGLANADFYSIRDSEIDPALIYAL